MKNYTRRYIFTKKILIICKNINELGGIETSIKLTVSLFPEYEFVYLNLDREIGYDGFLTLKNYFKIRKKIKKINPDLIFGHDGKRHSVCNLS